MNAIISLIVWVLALFGSPSRDAATNTHGRVNLNENNDISTNGVHIMNGNPRTVVALEDTHFRPM